ncbi:hypothetical protein [Ancylobacter amanitiformis]|uniref:Pimeloyl-ACP methyl ester carboxylesterase n=1 Tax=Ancylobacter amanitiformis TaxID=217069 RepID=A0ABU0LTF9_9HYPH|nr:hypothetical protein [Ancylobacter amanitiformis]MDQ0512003.1 pimeloyl-ACP methyl ester carboxylesterase [Ancylobacter amanitiformis]
MDVTLEPEIPAAGRRLVLFLPGHDPTDMEYHHGRFANQAARFSKLWSFHVAVSARHDDEQQHLARWNVECGGPNWREEVDYWILRWDDIVVALDERPDPVRLWGGFGGLFDFWAGGATSRYVEASIQYVGFFLFPFVLVGLFAAGGLLAGWFADHLLAEIVPSPVAWLIGIMAAIAVFFGLFRQPGRYWRLHQALDDWDLARNYLHDRTPELNARLDQFADELVEAVRSKRYDEVLLVGHSLGATLMLGVLDRALDREPALAEGPARLALLTCGATIPKFALHAKGDKVRRQARRVADTPGLTWVEFQSRHDVINFFEYHPVTLRDVAFDVDTDGAPMLRDANIKLMLSEEKYARIRLNALRLHYQFLLANERKAPYDYFMFALGPLAFADITSRPEGPIGRFAPDGSLIT